MSSLDITFCSNTKCKNLKCDRNQNNYDFSPHIIGNHPISIANYFEKCEFWKDGNNERN